MTREESIKKVKAYLTDYLPTDYYGEVEEIIEALEPKPYEKFESAKDHIYKLAGDYKCWDNRLTEDEAVELCHILEQQPCYNPDEWCHDCSEYNQDKHCCPRYTKVIRNAVEEMKQQPCEDKIIEWKKDFKEYINALSMPRDDYKGIMEYIDELPVTSQEPCEDAISREDALMCMTGEYLVDKEYKPEDIISKHIRRLRALPPVQPKITNKSEKLIGSNDCIDRAQAQTELEMNACRYTLAKEHDCMGQVEWSDQLIKVSDAVDIIRHLSSVTPQEKKTGQWVLLDECSNSGYYCSECHKKLVKEGWSGTVKKIKYCPNCGCLMREGNDNGNE